MLHNKVVGLYRAAFTSWIISCATTAASRPIRQRGQPRTQNSSHLVFRWCGQSVKMKRNQQPSICLPRRDVFGDRGGDCNTPNSYRPRAPPSSRIMSHRYASTVPTRLAPTLVAPVYKGRGRLQRQSSYMSGRYRVHFGTASRANTVHGYCDSQFASAADLTVLSLYS
ncbi:hypothetical protein JYU34_001874 [Plutella xylostella]|uniref:Secreted protein n=1 Tax=Plutella xylostella TaxID=51655 RepID=A0ABQ7R505_PLUXY|nr:hypothetical protein JYU34_001874 [Plutella xylostella]